MEKGSPGAFGEGVDYCSTTLDDEHSESELRRELQTLRKAYSRAMEFVDDGRRLMQRAYTQLMGSDYGSLRSDVDALSSHIAAIPMRERVLQVLDNEVETWMPHHLAERLRGVMRGLTHNTHDERFERKHSSKITKEMTVQHRAKRDMARDSLIAHLLRLRHFRATPPVVIMDSIERLYFGTTKPDWAAQSKQRKLLSRQGTVDAVMSICPYTPPKPAGREYQSQIVVQSMDNLEFWLRVKFSGFDKQGNKVQSELLHTVTGETFPVPAELYVNPAAEEQPVPAENWPCLGKYDLRQFSPSPQIFNVELDAWWNEMLGVMSTELDGLLRRPPRGRDKRAVLGATYLIHAGVIYDCGTSSYADAQRIIDHSRAAFDATKRIIMCDVGLFPRLWALKYRNRAANADWVPFAGEFHAHAHAIDAVVSLCWTYDLCPILLYFGVKGFGVDLVMKEYSTRYHWIIKIVSAGLLWLSEIVAADLLSDFRKLLDKVKSNLPVFSFVGFLAYFGGFLWKFKRATQEDDAATLDFMWRYGFNVHGATRKKIIK